MNLAEIRQRCLDEADMIQLGHCKFCTRPLWQQRKGRDKEFCDDVCRDKLRREEAGSE